MLPRADTQADTPSFLRHAEATSPRDVTAAPHNLKGPVSRVHTLLAAKKVKLAAVFMANPLKLALVQVLG